MELEPVTTEERRLDLNAELAKLFHVPKRRAGGPKKSPAKPREGPVKKTKAKDDNRFSILNEPFGGGALAAFQALASPLSPRSASAYHPRCPIRPLLSCPIMSPPSTCSRAQGRGTAAAAGSADGDGGRGRATGEGVSEPLAESGTIGANSATGCKRSAASAGIDDGDQRAKSGVRAESAHAVGLRSRVRRVSIVRAVAVTYPWRSVCGANMPAAAALPSLPDRCFERGA